jgi:hypothetical protein
MMNCVVCSKPLTGNIDTFGPIGVEMCQSCYLNVGDEPDNIESWYGLGPHRHTYDENGRIVFGSTEFLPLPEPDENGDYVFGSMIFTPDPEAPGCGVWSRRV